MTGEPLADFISTPAIAKSDGLYGKSRRVHDIYEAGNMQDVTMEGGVLQERNTLAQALKLGAWAGANMWCFRREGSHFDVGKDGLDNAVCACLSTS